MVLKRALRASGHSLFSFMLAVILALTGVLYAPIRMEAAEVSQGTKWDAAANAAGKAVAPAGWKSLGAFDYLAVQHTGHGLRSAASVGLKATNSSNSWKTSRDLGRVAARVQVPILMYHNICEDPNSPEISQNTISRRQFEEEMKLLVSMGRNTVTFDQMIDYVEKGTPLPDKPVCITFDDGYLSNYKIAFPILKKYRMKATIFVIGSSVGSTQYYKDTKFSITPHFDFAQAKEMSDSGLVSIQTHTYDMHQWPEYETGDKIRKNILKLPNETEEEYAAVLEQDFIRAKSEIEAVTGKPVKVLAYPGGSFNALSQKLLHSFGVKATLSIEAGKAVLIRGASKSLQRMNRYYITPETTTAAFRAWVG